MRRTFALVALLAMATTMLIGMAAGPAAAAGQDSYYVSLGDSAAAGYQPNGRFDRGYADQLAFRIQAHNPNLELVKLGCPEETTESLITGVGSPCSYPAGSQLDQATNFLHAHQGRIKFITINIGGNDVLGACFDGAIIHLPCVRNVMPQVEANLAEILKALANAAPGVPIAGMSYWDPFLGFWIIGPTGEQVATFNARGIHVMNAGLVSTYEASGALVADVAGPDFYDIENFTDMVNTQWGVVPVNVAKDCTWTWLCADPPFGGDIHPTNKGYAVIADAFEAVLRF
jgi:lysophospholipase L1-like esterase